MDRLDRFLGKLTAIPFILVFALLPLARVSADSPNSGFSVLITPSPITATVTPGKTTNIQLRILNNGSQTETLNIASRSFSINNNSGQVNISSNPSAINSWLSFSNPNFSLASGQWQTENIGVTVPKDAGFSYYFALSITRKGAPIVSSGRTINASVDDFVLLNVNRPGAKESLNLVSFKASRHIYQWLPASFNVRLKNTGNTIVQPSGNIFIKRSASDKTSIDTLTINGNGGYILPGSDRIFNASWSQGFPSYVSTTAASGATQTHLSFSLSKSSSFRFGKYNAGLVIIYNNGVADIPLSSDVSFWVLPWIFILIALVIFLIFAYGFYSLGRRIYKTIKKGKNKNKTKEKEPKQSKKDEEKS